MDAFCGNSFPAVEEGQSGVGKKPLYGIGEKVAQKYGNSFDREGNKPRKFSSGAERVEKVRHASRGYPIPPGYAAWFLTKPAAIPPVSRPRGRGSWYKNQAHVLIFMIFNFVFSLK